MARLEDLTKDAVVPGVLVDGQVTVVDAKWHGSNFVELNSKNSVGWLDLESAPDSGPFTSAKAPPP